MNFKGILAGAAAVAAGATSAYAADLPVAAEPVDYVRVCDAYGTGFYYIPGTDTCLRIAGRVRVDAYMNDALKDGGSNWDGRSDNGTSTRARAYIYLDSRTNTEYGLLRTYMETYFTQDSGSSVGTTLNQAYIQFGDFTFGRAQSFYDYFTGNAFDRLDGNWSDRKTWTAAYTYAFGNGLSASVAIEDPTYARADGDIYGDDFDETMGSNYYGGSTLPDVVANLHIEQGWGNAQVMAALHEARLGEGTVNGDPANKLGWAIGGGVTYNLPMLAAGDSITFQANYADGAVRYAGITADAVDITDLTGSAKTSKAWSLSGGLVHNWSAHWQTNMDASYADVDMPANRDWTRSMVSANLLWLPVSGLTIGAEVQYANTDYNKTLNAGGADDSDELVGTFRVQRTF